MAEKISETPLTPDSEQPPPTYDSIEADPPPAYDTLYGELKNAKIESSGPGDFLLKVIVVIVSTIGCTVCLGLSVVIPIACIVIGAKYKDDCPAETMIPIYLIVMGSFGVLRNLMGLCSQVKKRNDDNETTEGNKKTACERTIDCFLMAWFIAGNVWIYRIYEPSYDALANPLTYCDHTLYLFAFWLTTASYIFIGLLCCCMCCILCASVVIEDSVM